MHIVRVESYMRQFEISGSAFILSSRKRHFRAVLQGIVGTVKPRAYSKFQIKYVFSIVELSERKILTEQYCTIFSKFYISLRINVADDTTNKTNIYPSELNRAKRLTDCNVLESDILNEFKSFCSTLLMWANAILTCPVHVPLSTPEVIKGRISIHRGSKASRRSSCPYLTELVSKWNAAYRDGICCRVLASARSSPKLVAISSGSILQVYRE